MILEPMANMSELIAEATRKPENARFQIGGVTAGEWFTRRLSSQRVTNQKVRRLLGGGVGNSSHRVNRVLRRGGQVEERNTWYQLIEVYFEAIIATWAHNSAWSDAFFYCLMRAEYMTE